MLILNMLRYVRFVRLIELTAIPIRLTISALMNFPMIKNNPAMIKIIVNTGFIIGMDRIRSSRVMTNP